MNSSCYSSNSIDNGYTQQPIESYHLLCPGNEAPDVYEYCGGVDTFEEVFEAAPDTAAISSECYCLSGIVEPALMLLQSPNQS